MLLEFSAPSEARTVISRSPMISRMCSDVKSTDIGSDSNVEWVITTASQSPVAMRETNSRRRSPQRSSFDAISTEAHG